MGSDGEKHTITASFVVRRLLMFCAGKKDPQTIKNRRTKEKADTVVCFTFPINIFQGR